MYEKIGKTAEFIKSKKATNPLVGIVLGSGLGAFVDCVEDQTIIPYDEIPNFHDTTVEGHEGRMILGKIDNVEVVILQGRFHAYEGHSMEEVVFPVRVLATLGIESLILTNAAGGVNTSYKPGDLVNITDHINFTGTNPLIGPNNNELGPRFPDMTYAYCPNLRSLLNDSAKEVNVKLNEGVYAGLLGPTYETPAEIRMLRTLGADMVGMSTVSESIAANHLGIKVCGVSCVTNMAAGIEKEILKHEDIKEQALKVMNSFSELLKTTIIKIGNQSSK